MAKKTTIKKEAEVFEEPEKKSNGFFDYLRFGESYTSLILGIIVVIIATALLLSFVHNKNVGNVNTPISQDTQNTVQVTQKALNLAQRPPSGKIQDAAPTETPVPEKVTPTVAPTNTPAPKKVTKIAQVKPTQVAKKAQPKKVASKKTQQHKTTSDKNIWTVQKGESLWLIAEKKYNSGYNWVDIARANNLSDPSDIHAGDRLKLPDVTPKQQTIATNDEQNSKTVRQKSASNNNAAPSSNGMTKITAKTYTVVRGDNLWDIAVRAYGDGFRWVDIARANNLANPRVIHAGNKFTIPR